MSQARRATPSNIQAIRPRRLFINTLGDLAGFESPPEFWRIATDRHRRHKTPLEENIVSRKVITCGIELQHRLHLAPEGFSTRFPASANVAVRECNLLASLPNQIQTHLRDGGACSDREGSQSFRQS